MTIEITHTEKVDGFEYFVFSTPSYEWPPLPDFFWGGGKVRLSEDGHLVFSLKDEDVPVYNFGPHFDYADTVDTNYILKHKKHVRYDYRFNFLNTGFVGSRFSRYIGIEQVLPPDLVYFVLYDETGVRNPAPVPRVPRFVCVGIRVRSFSNSPPWDLPMGDYV